MENVENGVCFLKAYQDMSKNNNVFYRRGPKGCSNKVYFVDGNKLMRLTHGQATIADSKINDLTRSTWFKVSTNEVLNLRPVNFLIAYRNMLLKGFEYRRVDKQDVDGDMIFFASTETCEINGKTSDGVVVDLGLQPYQISDFAKSLWFRVL